MFARPVAPPPAISVTWPQVCAFRLRRHHLVLPAPDPIAVARDLCGVHGQVMSSAELALGVRSPGLSAEGVGRALWSERTLVKTWAMRGTLHLLASGDLALYTSAARARRHWLEPAWLRAMGVSEAEMRAVVEAVPVVLDGRRLTREQLADEVARHVGSEHVRERMRSGWGALLKPAAYRGDLCHGPNQGRKVTFVRPDQWVGPGQPVEPDVAFAEVVRRYLAAHGPASRDDVARWWGGMTPAEVGRALQSLEDELVPVDVEGRRAWLRADDLDELKTTGPAEGVRLLPGFDQYVVAASAHLERLLAGGRRELVSRTAGWISPVLLVDGRVAGVWSHRARGDRLLVEVTPFAPLPARVRAGLEPEAAKIGAFLRRAPTLTVVEG